MSSRARTSYCTFRLGEARLALPVTEIGEVLRAPPCTPVPLATATVAGLINLRGRIVTVLDLAARLGIPGASRGAGAPEGGFVLVLAGARDGVGLRVDDVGDVLALADDELEPPPANLPREARARVRGVRVDATGLWTVLDLAGVLDPQAVPRG